MIIVIHQNIMSDQNKSDLQQNSMTFVGLLKNINFSNIYNSSHQYITLVQKTYWKNKYHIDLGLCFICFIMIMLGWLNLSLILTFYFSSLVYMTVRTLAYFYNEIVEYEKKGGSFKIGLNNSEMLRQISDYIDINDLKKYVTEFVQLVNNWLLYSSLIICDWILLTLISLIGSGLIIGPILQVVRFLLYLQYCKQFIKSLEQHCQEMLSSEKAFISDKVAKILSIPIHIKHLINLMVINNVFCFNFFAKVNLKILKLIDNCSSSGIDMLSNIMLECLEQVSRAKSLSSVAANNTRNLFDPLIKKVKTFMSKTEKNKKNC